MSVAPDIYLRACHRPGIKSRTYDWRVPAIKGQPAPALNTARVTPSCQVLDLEAALARSYATDAHMFAYHVPSATPGVPGLSPAPRLAKDLFEPTLEHPQGWWATTDLDTPVVDVLFADVDNPNHEPWCPAYLAEFERLYASAPSLATAGVYHSRRGWRVVQPLAASLSIHVVERYLGVWLLGLERDGIAVDWRCKDWTRYWRMPHVVRDHQPYRSPVVRLERMRAITLPELPDAVDPPTRTRSTPRAPISIPVTDTLPARLERLVNALAAPLRAIDTDWHSLFLALAGALLHRGIPADAIVPLCERISIATSADSRTDDRVLGARTSVSRHLAGLRVAGIGELRRRWPAVAYALDDALRPPSAARPVPETLPAQEASAVLANALRQAGRRHGVSLISSDCGVGKSAAAIRVAIERAADRPDASRAPAGSKTAISTPTTVLAEQITRDLRAAGTPALRIFGPLSVRHAGVPVCQFYDAASALQQGGHSVSWEFCRGRGRAPCEHLQTCPAALGEDGPDDARITVGVHALLSELDGAAGTNGLLVIDEPPQLLGTTLISLGDLAAAEAQLGAYDTAYADAVTPILRPVAAWVREIAAVPTDGTVTEPFTLAAVLDAAVDAIDSDELSSARTAAYAADPETTASTPSQYLATVAKPNRSPPLRFAQLQIARRSPAIAKQLGQASRVFDLLSRAARPSCNARLRIVVDPHTRVRSLAITLPDQALERALQRDGSVAVLDANIDQHAPVIERVVGYAPPLTSVAAADGSPIERVQIALATANRRQWFDRGVPVWSAGIVAALDSVVAWALEDPNAQALGLITYSKVEFAIAYVWATLTSAPDTYERLQRAYTAGLSDGDLAEARPLLAASLSRWLSRHGTLVTGHYGAVRGLNSFAGVDALATLGDPWPQIDHARHDAAYLGLPDAEQRIEDLARAELEQAHGRLRVVHRTQPGRALHVGRVRPSGTGWAGTVHIRHPSVGRRPNADSVDLTRVRALVDLLGGVSAAARHLDVDRKTIGRYLSGERNPSVAFVRRLEALLPQTSASQHGTEMTVAIPATAISVPPRYCTSELDTVTRTASTDAATENATAISVPPRGRS